MLSKLAILSFCVSNGRALHFILPLYVIGRYGTFTAAVGETIKFIFSLEENNIQASCYVLFSMNTIDRWVFLS